MYSDSFFIYFHINLERFFNICFQKTHGPPTNPKDQRHMGDFGNINVTKGKATVDLTDNVASIFGPPETSVSCKI